MDFISIMMAIGKWLAATAIMELIRPQVKPAQQAAIGLKDLSFPTADPARPVQYLVGRSLVDNANLFGTWDFRVQLRSKKVRSGLFTKTRVPLPPVFYLSMAMVLCGGSGAKLRRIYVGDRLAWEGEIVDGGHVDINVNWTEEGQADYPRGVRARIEFHSGSTLPNEYLDAKLDGKAPTWKHLTYVVVRGIPPEPEPDTATGLPALDAGAVAFKKKPEVFEGAWIGSSKTVEHLKFETERMPSAVTTGLGEHPDGGAYWAIGPDANPAYAIAELLASERFGAGQDPADFDAGSFHAAAKALYDEAHGTSFLWSSQRKTGEVGMEVCRQIGAILRPEPASALHQLRLLRASDQVAMTLDDSNVIDVETFSRSTVDEATNALRLEYTARDEQYKVRPVEVQDLAAVQAAGQVIAGTAQYAGITSAAVAVSVGMRDLRAISAPLATERLTAIVPKTSRLLPGDVVLRVAPEDGVESLRMRVASASYSKPGQARCELELIEDVFFSGAATYVVPPPTEAPPSGASSMPSVVDASGPFARFILAPYGLTKDEADHALFYAAAPDQATTEYTVGLYADGSDEPEELENPSEFAAFGTLRTQLADTHATTTVQVDIGPAAAETLTRYGSSAVYCVVESGALEPEWLQAAALSLSADGTVLTLTGVRRGLFDTLNRHHAAGSNVHVLTGFALDPERLATAPRAANGIAYTSTAGQGTLEIEAYGANSLSRAAAGTRAPVDRSPAGGGHPDAFPGPVRAPLPAPPGNVLFDAIHGGSTPARAVERTISANVSGAATVRVDWTPRSRFSSTAGEWLGSTAEHEPSVFYHVEFARQDGPAWTVLHAGTTAAGATSFSATHDAGWAGVLRVTVTPRRAAGPNSYVNGKSQSWFWAVTQQ